MTCRTWILLGALALGGCTGGDKGDDAFADTGGGFDGDSGGGGEAGGDDPAPADWLLALTFEIAEGDLHLGGSELAVTLRDGSGQELCTERGLPERVELLEGLEEAYLVGWELGLPSSWSGECGVEALPLDADVQLLVGELHPEAAALVEGLDEAADGSAATLNGSYVSLDGGATLYVLGAAGLPAAYAAETGPAVEAPLDDGTWLALPVYAFPL